MQRKTKIKICGLRRQQDVKYVNELLPDYIGFVFAESRRQVTREQAAALARSLDERIRRVGVFVDQPPELVADLLEKQVIQLAQLHGEEDAVYMEKLRDCCREVGADPRIVKAVRVKTAEDIERAARYDCEYLLLDAWSDQGAGGNGVTFDWSVIQAVQKEFFLAGGLTAENVAEAIRQVHPYGVDASSGLETEGFKDWEKMKQFINQVRQEDRDE